MKLRHILILFLPLLFTACGNHSREAEKIELNNGQKWAVNVQMKPHIEKGRELLSSYLAENSTDHKQLAADLQEQNSNLIKSCTMDGKAHDELHKWLHPHLELVKELSKTSSKNEADNLIAELQQSYKTYELYFE